MNQNIKLLILEDSEASILALGRWMRGRLQRSDNPREEAILLSFYRWKVSEETGVGELARPRICSGCIGHKLGYWKCSLGPEEVETPCPVERFCRNLCCVPIGQPKRIRLELLEKGEDDEEGS